ncbi:cytochrome P450 [Hymenopellis radicata]|nr:cytochrome P450 [Hymenopellis radicata]
MHVVLQVLSALISALLVVAVVNVAQSAYQYYSSPLRRLRGPEMPSLLWGNMQEIWAADPGALFGKWVKQYGAVITFTGFLGSRRLLTTDTKAISHILHNAYDYPKPDETRYNIARMIGPGILVVEGHQHKQQRKVMSPAFAPSHMRELTTTFLDKSIQLRDILAAECAMNPDGALRTDALSWLNRVTLDIIGLTGFNYKFDSLNDNGAPNELNVAFSKIFSAGSSSLFRIMQGYVPILRLVPTIQGATMRAAQATMSRIGYNLLNESRTFLEASGGEKENNGRSRDLLSLLLRANMSTDIPESQRMSDEDVIAQVPTFLVAGHETTASAVTWLLYAITKEPEVQKKLREELLSVATEAPSLDELNALPYLDMVVRETLRIHTPVPNSIRVAGKDDVIPTSKPFMDKNGVVCDSIRIKKGDSITIPLHIMNTDPSIWGEDAAEFKPERWEKTPEAVSAIPGVWGNIMTFLGGPRACIGYRFSLAETKALVFTLIRAFEVELAVPHEDLAKKTSVVQRPYLRNNAAAGNQLPIIFRPVHV